MIFGQLRWKFCIGIADQPIQILEPASGRESTAKRDYLLRKTIFSASSLARDFNRRPNSAAPNVKNTTIAAPSTTGLPGCHAGQPFRGAQRQSSTQSTGK